MKAGVAIGKWGVAFLLAILGGGMSACADGTSWKEEVAARPETIFVTV